MDTVDAQELRPGDVVDYHGEVHCVARVELRPGWLWAIAFDGTGWAMALGGAEPSAGAAGAVGGGVGRLTWDSASPAHS